MKGETVVVVRRIAVGQDASNNTIYDTTEERVENVLVGSGPRTDVIESNRREGTEVVWNLHFPKTFTGSLRGAAVKVRGGEPCDVIGDPQPYTLVNTPTKWCMPVEVRRADG